MPAETQALSWNLVLYLVVSVIAVSVVGLALFMGWLRAHGSGRSEPIQPTIRAAVRPSEIADGRPQS